MTSGMARMCSGTQMGGASVIADVLSAFIKLKSVSAAEPTLRCDRVFLWTVWLEVDIPLGWGSRRTRHRSGGKFILLRNACFFCQTHLIWSWITDIFCVFAAGRYSALWSIYWWTDRLIDTETNCWFWCGLVGVLLCLHWLVVIDHVIGVIIAVLFKRMT